MHFDGTLTGNREDGASFIPRLRPERLVLRSVTWVERVQDTVCIYDSDTESQTTPVPL